MEKVNEISTSDKYIVQLVKDYYRVTDNWKALKAEVKELRKNESWPEIAEAFDMVLETMEKLEKGEEE